MPSFNAGRPFDLGRATKSVERASDWHLPDFFKRLLPPMILRGLREAKARIVTRAFPRGVQFEISRDDMLACKSMSITIPIHDAPAVTSRCLNSIERFAANAEVILVDDASKLIETRRMIDHFSDKNGWKVIRNEESVGHSAACMAGANIATRPYLCLLNSDTVVTPWCWRGIKEVFDRDQKIGVAGPSTSNAGTSQTLPLASTFLPYWNNNQICNFASSLLNHSHEPPIDLTWVSGFAFFVRRNLWEELGGFDRNLPDYGNEVELCKRIQNAGYRTVWVRASYIHHLGQQSYRNVIGDEGILMQIQAAKTYTEEKGRASGR